ncbi:MAG: translocation/assembly module TamB domain-containing protein [Novosphingobium sp.]|nr:translocation/assembly module TamB domain-containing protein [Novosphingobium sp.]
MSGDATDDPPPVDTPPARRWRGWRLRLVKTVVALVLGVVALAGLAVLVLDTGPGHRFVADMIGRYAFANGMRIDVARIDGSLYGRMVLRDVSVRDTKGEFLFTPEVRVDWRPLAFLNNHVDVRSAVSPRVSLRRVPAFRATPPSDAPLLPDIDIDVGKLQIDRFIAEEPVSGLRRIGRITGRAKIADGRAQVWLDAATAPVPGAAKGAANGGGDRLVLTLDAVPEADRLDLALDLDAPRGGTIAALAGLAQPLSARVAGKGDWKAWNGTIAADLGGGELARLALTARNGTFALKGPTRIARLFTGPTAALLGPTTTLDLTAALDQRRATITGKAGSDAFVLDAKGGLDLGASRFDGLNLAFALLKPSALAPNLAGSGLTADLTLDGAFATPGVRYTLSAARLVMNDMGLERLTAKGAARIDADHILIPVEARVARITGLDSVAGGTLSDVRLNGDLAIDGPRILSDNMRIRSDRIDARLILLADTAKGLYTGAVDGKIDNYRIESVGTFAIETQADLRAEPGGGFSLAGKVRARSKTLTNAGVRDFLGGNAVASADVRYGADGVVRFAALRLNAPLLRVTGGSGSYAPDGRIALNADAVSSQYGPVGVRVTGTIANPQAHVTATRPGLGIGLADLDAQITGAPGGYRLKATGATDYGPLTADVVLGLEGATTLRIDSADLGGIQFAGTLRQVPSGPFAGQLTANGRGLTGLVRLGAQGKFQEALFNLRATDTVLPGPARLAIGSAIVDGRVVLYDKPWVVADAQVAQTTFGGFDINAARVIIDYRDGRGQAKAMVEGAGGAPFRLAANADLTPQLWKVMIDGRVRGTPFRTSSPARIVPGKAGYELLPTRIDMGRGNMRLAGTWGAGNAGGIKLESRLDALNLSIVNAFLPGYGIGGQATGSLDFAQAGPAAFPRADARLSIDNFTRTTATSVSQAVDVNFVGKLLPDGGEARAVFRQRGTVIGRMQASLRPLPPGTGSWTERLREAPLTGGIRYNGPADTLMSLSGAVGQRLSGPIAVAADFSCRVSSPCLQGVVRGNALTYENQAYGTRLTQMAVTGRFTGERLEIETLTARAGDGTVSAKGYVSLAADAGYPMDIAATVQNARVARSDALSARATGTLRLTKQAGETALLSGELRLPETRYQMIRQGAAEVPQLSGVRFKPSHGRQLVTGDEPPTPSAGLLSLIRLDLKLIARDELYVSGMGLESEWRANFHVGGTSAQPTLAGQVELLRGTLGFAGRQFELSSGHLDFTGGQTIDPVIAIAGSDDVDDITVTVNVSGRAFNPQVTFSSTPSLPQDEIVSRILFGSSIANLSAIQAVQLAASLNSLRATGGGLNPLGKLRSAAGIDRLRILGADEATGRGTALAAGQYITNDIYVELITDARGFTATQLEISLSKALSILSQAGGSGVTNFNLRLRKNY